MRSRRFALGVLGSGLIIASCVGRDLPTGAGGEAGHLEIALQPALIPSPADASALPINRIRAIVEGMPDGDVLLDTQVEVSPTAASWTVDLRVPLPGGPRQARVILYLVHMDAGGTASPQFSGRSAVLDLAVGGGALPVDVDFVRGPIANLFTTSLAITSAPTTLAVGATAELQATVTADPSPPLPLVFWTSLEPGILTMTGSVATGTSAGTARVVASAGTFADTVSIAVFVPPVDSVQVSPDSADVVVGATRSYTALLRDAGGTVLTGRPIEWSTGNAGVATVSTSGVVTGVAPGVTTVTATSEGVSDDGIVRVLAAPSPGGATITWVRSGSGVWSDPTGWDLGRAPQPGDTVRLTQGLDYAVTLDVDASVARLVIGGTSDVINLLVGDYTLGLDGAGTGPELEILPLGGIEIANGLVAATEIWNEGSVRTTGAASVSAARVDNHGTWRVVSGTQFIGMAPGVDFHNIGALVIDASSSLVLNTSSQLTYAGGTVQGGGLLLLSDGSTLVLDEDLSLSGTSLVLQGSTLVSGLSDRLTIEPGTALSLVGSGGPTSLDATVVNRGTIYSNGLVEITDSLHIEASGVVSVDAAGAVSTFRTGGVDNAGQILLVGAGQVAFGPGDASGIRNRQGAFIQTAGTGTYRIDGQLVNEGSVLVAGATALLRRDPTGVDVTASHVSSGSVDVMTNGSLGIVLGGTSPTFTNAGSITVNAGTLLEVTNLATPAGAIINSATGVLQGTGTVRFNPGSPYPDPTGVNNGTIAPGLSPGVLTWQGQIPMGPTGVILLEIEGTTPGTGYDQLNASADLVLDLGSGGPPTGSLVVVDPAFVPSDGDRFAVMTFRSRFGNFATVTLPAIPGITLDTVWAEAGTTDTLFIVASASGAPVLNSWVNASGGSWSVGANWSRGVPPAATDSVVIELSGTYTVTLDTDASVRNLTIGGDAGVQTLAGTNRFLTLGGPSTIRPNGRLDQTNLTLLGTGALTNQGTTSISGGSLANPVANSGTLLIGGTVAFNGALTTAVASTLRVGGLPGNTNLTVANGFTNNGVLELTSTSGGYSSQLTVTNGTLVNANAGTLLSTVGGGSSRTVAAPLDNSGLVSVNFTMTLASTVMQRSTLTVFIPNTLTIGGLLTLDVNSTTQVDGTLVLIAGCVSAGGGPIFGTGQYPACGP